MNIMYVLRFENLLIEIRKLLDFFNKEIEIADTYLNKIKYRAGFQKMPEQMVFFK